MSEAKPTIVLVHGAFADSSSWYGVVPRLHAADHHVHAAANPLRTLDGDAEYVESVLAGIEGPVVLAAHSYGGMVVTNAAAGNDRVRALVYVAAFAPDEGESAADLSTKHGGSTLPETLVHFPLPDGGKDLYIAQDRFHAQFMADAPAAEAELAAAAQRPLTQAAIEGPSGRPAWKAIPSFFIWGSEDRSIPPTVHRMMAERANAQQAIELPGASHDVEVSCPDVVAQLILDAAAFVSPGEAASTGVG
ncbi:alpha/beta fold hydrolase [Pseudonocardia xinjiangensis]|uniref:alpha/beta fold hydrolase n=1 Tax=Pseudonocardia xinjiangensis TaxID=75289 RepID=UPI003D8AEDB7